MRLVIPLPATAPENLLQIQIGTKGGWSGSYNAPKGTDTFEVDVRADSADHVAFVINEVTPGGSVKQVGEKNFAEAAVDPAVEPVVPAPPALPVEPVQAVPESPVIPETPVPPVEPAPPVEPVVPVQTVPEAPPVVPTITPDPSPETVPVTPTAPVPPVDPLAEILGGTPIQ